MLSGICGGVGHSAASGPISKPTATPGEVLACREDHVGLRVMHRNIQWIDPVTCGLLPFDACVQLNSSATSCHSRWVKVIPQACLHETYPSDIAGLVQLPSWFAKTPDVALPAQIADNRRQSQDPFHAIETCSTAECRLTKDC